MYQKIRKSKIRKGPSSTPAEDIGNNVTLNNKIIDKNVQDFTYGSNKSKSNKIYTSELSFRGNNDMTSTDLLQNKNVFNKQNIDVNNIKNNKNLTPRDLEIMNIFTSRRWSKKSYPRSIVNMQVDKKASPINEEIEKDISVRIDYKQSSGDTNEENYNSTIEYENTSTDIARESNDSLVIKDEHAGLENNRESLNELVKISTEQLSEILKDEQDLENNEENLNKFVRKSIEEFPEIQRAEQDLVNNQENLNEFVKISAEQISEILKDEQDLENNQENLNKFIEKSVEDFSEVQKNEQDLETNQENLNENIRKSRELEVLSDTLSNISFENVYFETSNTYKKSESPITSITSNKDMIFEDLLSDAEKISKTSKNINILNESATNQNNIEEENYSYELNKDYSKEQVALQKLGPTMELTTQLSKDEMWMNKAFMQHFYIDDISDPGIIDTSSIWSFNTTMMAQIIRNQVQTTDNNIVVEKTMIDEAALNAAFHLMFEKTKNSLGNQLIEGLYIVSKEHRDDPFRYLGQWLLIQADIRDENNV